MSVSMCADRARRKQSLCGYKGRKFRDNAYETVGYSVVTWIALRATLALIPSMDWYFIFLEIIPYWKLFKAICLMMRHPKRIEIDELNRFSL
jgi:hypothetical protein